MVVMIASLHTFALNLHPYLADFISFFHPYLLTFAGLWVGLSHMEVSAKKENAHYVQSLRFENHQVSYRGQTRHLKNLVTVDEGGYRKIYPLRPPSELSLIFQGEKTLHLPVQLTAEEILWFMHLLEKHK